MKVFKFGGTSVGSADRIRNVADIVKNRGKNIVVLSAMSGTTNTLVEISDYLYKKNVVGAKDTINQLEQHYIETLNQLFQKDSLYKDAALGEVKACFDHIRTFTHGAFTSREEKEILAQGEIMTTAMMNAYLQSIGYNSVVLPTLDYMRIDADGEPDTAFIKENLFNQLNMYPDADIYITQGYICRNDMGEVDNLQRGGSDYTASLIGAAINAEEIEIWTDIDGMHNNDPRFVEGTNPVECLRFEEAAELAYFGAKILHPTCILPARLNNIPVRLLNTLEPSAKGTIISNYSETKKIKAVAAKDGIVVIRVKSGRSLLAQGFLRKVFEIFDTFKTPIDLVTTSEVAVSVAIDNTRKLDDIVDELKKFGTVKVDYDMVIICVVGDLNWQNEGFEALTLEAFHDIPVRMISYGGSNYNISFVVNKCNKVAALNALSNHIFKKNN